MDTVKNLIFLFLWNFVSIPYLYAGTDDRQIDQKDLLLPKYEKLLNKYSSKEKPLLTCVPPEPKWNKKTNQYRTAIRYKFEEDGGKPNFCARYFLMVTPITGGGDIFIFDCKTGRPTVYLPKWAAPTPLMRLESCAFVVHPPGPDYTVSDFTPTQSGFKPEPVFGPPRIYRFDGKRVLELEDKIWPKTKSKQPDTK